MPLARPTASRSRSVVGMLQTALHRHRGLRWAAACGAAIATFSALSPDSSDSGAADRSSTEAMLAQEKLAARLPTATRGVSVPSDGGMLQPGDYVDVHATRTGAAVAANVLVVEAIDDSTVIAVHADHVDAVVASLADGGVMLVLVPEKTA